MRFDRERLLDLELVRWITHDKVEALEDGDKGELRFLPRERTTLLKS